MSRGRSICSLQLLFGAVMAAALCAPVQARPAAHYDIAPQSLKTALIAFGLQSGRGVVGASNLTDWRSSRGFSGDATDAATALRQVLRGTGLTFRRDGDSFVIVAARAEHPALVGLPSHQDQGVKIG